MEEVRVNEQFYQCIDCGCVHRSNIDKVDNLGDAIYYGNYCPHCRGTTKHLWVGKNESEVIEFYDHVLDERYYTTK